MFRIRAYHFFLYNTPHNVTAAAVAATTHQQNKTQASKKREPVFKCVSAAFYGSLANSVPFDREKESHIFCSLSLFLLFLLSLLLSSHSVAPNRIGMLLDFVSHNSISNQIQSVCLWCIGLFM